MRVAIVGATGNVGTSVVEALSAEDSITEVVGLARRLPAWKAPKTTFVSADVTSSDLVPYFEGTGAVVHLAWLFQPTHRPLVTWRTNVEGSIRVFEAAVKAEVPILVYASSVGAYSPGPGKVVDESWPTHSAPTAGYGREKAYVERVLDTFEANHPEVRLVRMRPAFIFKRQSASEQRRIFAGPLVPRPLARRGRLPMLPVPAGLRFQALHTADAAQAYRLSVVRDVRGAFNIAADPVVDAGVLGELLEARPLTVPRPLARAVVATAWHLHLAPTDPTLFDLVLQLPLLDATRARIELGWVPRWSGIEALREMLEGLAEGAGMETEPLAPDSLRRRIDEVDTGMGERP
jgi:UDP-glucose 4-epimerase